MRRTLPVILALSLVVGLGGCVLAPDAPHPAPSTSPSQSAQDAIGALPGVAGLTVSHQDDNPGIGVELAANATIDQVVAAAKATWAFAKKNDHDGHYRAGLTAGGTVVVDTDLPTRTAVNVDLYPGTWKSAEVSVRAALGAIAIPSVTQVSLTLGWAFVTVTDSTTLADVVTELRTRDIFEDGASYTTSDLEGRVRIVDIPELESESAIETVGALASTYTSGQFWLESPTKGPKSPTLFVDMVTEDEATAIKAALEDPSLTADNSGNRAMPFVISWLGPNGRTDLTGSLGNQPAP